ncbi:MAG: hypothetical protein ABSE96_15320 [Terracidiphilus sp.]|jgi:hypothetical protein
MTAGPDSIPNCSVVLFPVAFVLFWIFICLVISVMSGWRALAESFIQQSEPCGQIKTAGPFFYVVYMRYWCHYSSVIRMTAADDAFYLSVLAIFRAGHPPLRIPWNEIHFVKISRYWSRFVVLTLGNREAIPMRISERMARNLGILNRMANHESQAQLRS